MYFKRQSICSNKWKVNGYLTNRDNVLKLIDLRKYDVVAEYTDDQYTNTSSTNTACLSTDSKYILVGGNAKVLLFRQDDSGVILII